MTRALDIFERLQKGGVSALDALIADREPESLFLDFKRSPRDGADTNLAADDNKNLSKAISGFGNSSGGVVVWGVDCRPDSSGIEVAKKSPLVDAEGFCTKLQAAISRTTVPPHPGVEMRAFEETGQCRRGYVAVFVPQSSIGPLRSIATNHYHIRIGSDFGLVSHDVLAGMFGRAPQPIVDVNLVSYPVRVDIDRNSLVLAVGIVIVNLGAVVGERPYLSGYFGDFPQEQLNLDIPDPEAFFLRRGHLPSFSVVASDRFLLAPGSTEIICNVSLNVPIDFPSAVRLELTLGVLGAAPGRFSLSASEQSVRAAIAKVATAQVQSIEVVHLVPG